MIDELLHQGRGTHGRPRVTDEGAVLWMGQRRVQPNNLVQVTQCTFDADILGWNVDDISGCCSPNEML